MLLFNYKAWHFNKVLNSSTACNSPCLQKTTQNLKTKQIIAFLIRDCSLEPFIKKKKKKKANLQLLSEWICSVLTFQLLNFRFPVLCFLLFSPLSIEHTSPQNTEWFFPVTYTTELIRPCCKSQGCFIINILPQEVALTPLTLWVHCSLKLLPPSSQKFLCNLLKEK